MDKIELTEEQKKMSVEGFIKLWCENPKFEWTPSKEYIKEMQRVVEEHVENKKKEPMTKIELDVSEDDFGMEKMLSLNGKCFEAYKEAKAKEIKVGDWCLDSDRDGDDIYRAEAMHIKGGWEHCIKLPQNLQDKLNDFISNKKEWNHQGEE